WRVYLDVPTSSTVRHRYLHLACDWIPDPVGTGRRFSRRALETQRRYPRQLGEGESWHAAWRRRGPGRDRRAGGPDGGPGERVAAAGDGRLYLCLLDQHRAANRRHRGRHPRRGLNADEVASLAAETPEG